MAGSQMRLTFICVILSSSLIYPSKCGRWVRGPNDSIRYYVSATAEKHYWEDALQKCLDMGAYLAPALHLSDAAFIVKLIRDEHGPFSWAWLGGVRNTKSDFSGEWHPSRGYPVSFFYWAGYKTVVPYDSNMWQLGDMRRPPSDAHQCVYASASGRSNGELSLGVRQCNSAGGMYANTRAPFICASGFNQCDGMVGYTRPGAMDRLLTPIEDRTLFSQSVAVKSGTGGLAIVLTVYDVDSIKNDKLVLSRVVHTSLRTANASQVLEQNIRCHFDCDRLFVRVWECSQAAFQVDWQPARLAPDYQG